MSNNSATNVATQALLRKLGISILLVVIFIFAVIVLIVASIVSPGVGGGGGSTGGAKEFSEGVLVWEDDIVDEMEKQNLDSEHLPVMLGILELESGGDAIETNGDIYRTLGDCGTETCINDPLESIEKAVVRFKENLSNSRNNLKVAIASFNFGDDFALWTRKNHDNEWSMEIALEFSAYMMGKVENPDDYTCKTQTEKDHNACFGDVHYVTKVTAFLVDENDVGKNVDFDGDLDFPLSLVYVTSNFGNRIIDGEPDDHFGIDLRCVGGLSPIFSSGNGKVTETQYHNSYGNVVVIEHDKNFHTLYAHLSSITVDEGDEVRLGTQVGVCGSTGNSTAPHLHFETKERTWGGYMNPRGFLDFPPEGEYK